MRSKNSVLIDYYIRSGMLKSGAEKVGFFKKIMPVVGGMAAGKSSSFIADLINFYQTKMGKKRLFAQNDTPYISSGLHGRSGRWDT